MSQYGRRKKTIKITRAWRDQDGPLIKVIIPPGVKLRHLAIEFPSGETRTLFCPEQADREGWKDWDL